jgi:hypothetical protein
MSKVWTHRNLIRKNRIFVNVSLIVRALKMDVGSARPSPLLLCGSGTDVFVFGRNSGSKLFVDLLS